MKRAWLFLFPLLLLSTDWQARIDDHPAGSTSGDTLRFLFMGHTYDWQASGDQVDPRLEGLNYGRYHRIMLGGDVCSETLARYSTLEYLDSLFDLGSNRTHFVMGNHDARNENWEWYEEFTGRRTFSTDHEHGITFFVLNTTLNAGDCEQLDAQFRLLESICDTISASSHLLILQHHGVTQGVPGLPSSLLDYVNWALPYWDANCYMDPPYYVNAIYPMLVDVQQRGVQVITVFGDAGVREKGRTMQSTDGLYYISSGIDNSRYANDSLALDTVPKDKVLLFEHVPDDGDLSWRFLDLDSLYDADN
jgi:hypothetical protein